MAPMTFTRLPLSRRPERYLKEVSPRSGFVTSLPHRPLRFAVGLREQVSPDRIKAPIQQTYYLGRVEDIDESGIVAVVWESPNGWRHTARIENADLATPRATKVGDLVRLWTWATIEGPGQIRDCAYAITETKQPPVETPR